MEKEAALKNIENVLANYKGTLAEHMALQASFELVFGIVMADEQDVDEQDVDEPVEEQS